jgi:hypothetical protein
VARRFAVGNAQSQGWIFRGVKNFHVKCGIPSALCAYKFQRFTAGARLAVAPLQSFFLKISLAYYRVIYFFSACGGALRGAYFYHFHVRASSLPALHPAGAGWSGA